MPLTLATAQAFVAKLSTDLATQVERQSVVLPAITRQYQREVVAADAALTINHTDRAGALLTANAENFTEVSATLAIQRLLDDPVFYQLTLETLAQIESDILETSALARAISFSTNSALGGIATPVVQAIVDQAVNTLLSQSPPPGEPIYLALRVAGTGESHQDVLNLAGVQDQTKVGSGIVTSVNVNQRLPRFRGMTILRSRNVRRSGAPAVTENVAFTSSALMQITCQMGLTNNATNIQAYSETPKMGLRVALALDVANDNQVVTIASRGASIIARQEYGIRVRS